MFKKILLGGTGTVLGLYASAVVYTKTTKGECHSNRDLQGRTVIVTGGNTGIGLETARDLAARNAKVILACRTLSKGQAAVEDIKNTTGNSNVFVKELDVGSFKSVRAFAEDILKTEKKIDILVNNAGILVPGKEKKNEDGLEVTMATNHYGPFLLTNLLLPLLKESAPARIVVVSSVAHESAKLNVEDLSNEKSCKGMKTYGISKLANVLFTRELSERLKDTGVTVNAVHPGVVKTELPRNMKENCKKAYETISGPLSKTPKEGAQTSIYVAVSEELEGVSGKYFSDCREKKLKKHALDENAAKKLWDYSEKVTKLSKSSN